MRSKQFLLPEELSIKLAQTRLCPNESRLLWAALQLIKGKAEMPIPHSAFARITSLPKSTVSRMLNRLLEKNILSRRKIKQAYCYRLNREWGEWEKPSEKPESPRI